MLLTRIAIKNLKQAFLALILWSMAITCFAFTTNQPQVIQINKAVWSSPYFPDVWGVRKKMADRGFYVMASYLMDLSWPTTGGMKTTSYPLYQFLFDLELGIVTEQLCHLKGGYFYIDFMVHNGKSPTQNYVGDAQGFDNIEAPPFTQLAELWYQQFFFDELFSVAFGKIDAYETFGYTHYAQILLNNSYTLLPTIIGYPTYPNPEVGIILASYPKKWITLKASIFDGSNAIGVQTGNLGAKSFFQNLGKHILFLNEIDFRWENSENKYKGILELGLWGYNGQLPAFNGGTMGKAIGPYATLSQQLWKQSNLSNKPKFTPGELGVFIQTSYVNQELLNIKSYIGGGVTYFNMWKKFYADALSIGAATVFFTKAPNTFYPKRFETSLEITYSLFFVPWIQVQPDLQWIIHPGGAGLKNALVATLRMSVNI